MTLTAGVLAELAGSVHPDTRLELELYMSNAELDALGFDVPLEVELERVDVTGRHRLIIVSRLA